MEDILERGFQLAYFMFPNRPQAVLILSAAINKLKTQHGRESRRNYWRDKYLKRGITRITREEGDTLQWLIFYESDHHEKEQEASHQATVQDMAVRYIKSLVRMTSAMSSFHVNIGLHRLLHNYSTTEVQQMYESITDRFLGADEYRRAKSVLMNKLAASTSCKWVANQGGYLLTPDPLERESEAQNERARLTKAVGKEVSDLQNVQVMGGEKKKALSLDMVRR